MARRKPDSTPTRCNTCARVFQGAQGLGIHLSLMDRTTPQHRKTHNKRREAAQSAAREQIEQDQRAAREAAEALASLKGDTPEPRRRLDFGPDGEDRSDFERDEANPFVAAARRSRVAFLATTPRSEAPASTTHSNPDGWEAGFRDGLEVAFGLGKEQVGQILRALTAP